MWPSFQIALPQSMVREDYNREFCEFWDSIKIYVNLMSSLTIDTSETKTTLSMTTSGIVPLRNSMALMFCLVLYKINFTLS